MGGLALSSLLYTHQSKHTYTSTALQSWIYNEARKQGGQQQHIKTSLSNTITDSLYFESDKINDWMLEAKEPKIWANQIETALNLMPNMYKPFKLRRW